MLTYFTHHLYALKNTIFSILGFLIINFIVNYFFINQYIYILTKPFLNLINNNYFITTDISEWFSLKLYLTSNISFFITYWFSLTKLWKFVAPGLYKSENCKIILWLITLFFNAALINFFLISTIIPEIWNFFIMFNEVSYMYLYTIHLEPKLSKYLELIIIIMFYINILFQYPLILFILINFKIISLRKLFRFRKILYITIWVLSTICSPPDLISQIVLGCLISILLELGILFFLILEKKYLFNKFI